MKGLLSAGGVALVVGVLLFAGRSSSEPQQPAAPQTRIGLVNLTYVIKNYKKIVTYTKEMKAEMAELDQTFKKRFDEISELSKKLTDKNLSDKERAEIAKQLDELQHELDDTKNKAKEDISKKTDKQMVTIYKEIHQAAERYAKAHDLELMLHYIEAVSEDDFYNPQNILLKIQQRGCFPLYTSPGLDVSKEIVAELNKNLADEKVSPADSK
jgi:Skp family chaperone for outer membrane proteins